MGRKRQPVRQVETRLSMISETLVLQWEAFYLLIVLVSVFPGKRERHGAAVNIAAGRRSLKG